MKYKVSSIVLNDFTRDSRVQKQAASLAKAGYDLTVFALWKKGLLEAETKEGFKIRRIRIFSSFLDAGESSYLAMTLFSFLSLLITALISFITLELILFILSTDSF